MIARTLIPNGVLPTSGRELSTAACTGEPVASYLPEAWLGAKDAAKRLRVFVDDCPVAHGDWGSFLPPDGSHVVAIRWPGYAAAVVAVIYVAAVLTYAYGHGMSRSAVLKRRARRRLALEALAMAESTRYGWADQHPLVDVGQKIPVLYGRKRIAGQFVYAQPRRNTFGMPWMDAVIVYSWGECDGIESGTIRVGNVPIQNLRQQTEIQAVPLATVIRFSDVDYKWLLGTSRQEWPGILRPFTLNSRSNPPGNQIASGTPVTYVTGPATTGIKLTISFPNGIFSRPTGRPGGQQEDAKVQFGVRWRALGTGTYNALRNFDSGWQTWITGSSAVGAFVMTYETPKLQAARWEIELTRTADTPLHSGYSVSATEITSYLTAVEETQDLTQNHPNLACLAITAQASAQVSGTLPNITAVWRGRLVRDITGSPAAFDVGSTIISSSNGVTLAGTDQLTDGSVNYNTTDSGRGVQPGDQVVISTAPDNGTYIVKTVNDAGNLSCETTTGGAVSFTGTNPATYTIKKYGVYSQNPALIIADLLTNDRFGAGEFCADDDLDLDAFKTAKDHFDRSVNDGRGGTEAYAQCDVYLDGATSAWDFCVNLATNARAFLFESAGKIKLVPDYTGGVVQTFGMGNIVPGSYKHLYLAARSLANTFRVQFWDRDQDFEQNWAQLEDPDVFTNSEERVESNEAAIGVTRMSEAQRLCKRLYLMARNVRQQIEFAATADAIAVEVGDVFRFIHETQRSELSSGRVEEGSTTSVINLDRDVTIPTGLTARLVVGFKSGSLIGTEEQNPIATNPGSPTRQVTLTLPLTAAPQKGDLWAIYQDVSGNANPRQWKCVGIKASGTQRRTITAINYVSTVYTDSDDPGDLPAIE